METHPAFPMPPSARRIFLLWFAIGAQSFGGGAAVQTMIYRSVVERERWMTAEVFTQTNALCQMTPGINQFALAILIGRSVRGPIGSALSLLGLLLPSVTFTVLFSVFYDRLRHLPALRAAISGLVPAVVGLGLLTAIRMAIPVFQASRREGAGSVGLSAAVVISCASAVALGHLPVLAVFGVAGTILALAGWRRSRLLSPGETR